MTSKAVTKTGNGKAVSTERQAALARLNSYGKTAGRSSSIEGTLLKFSKGEWLAGQDNEEIAEGTRMIVNVDSTLVGWIRWEDGAPAEQEMGPIIETDYKPKARDDLGWTDKDEWAKDERTGTPRDPWQKSNYVLMRTPGKRGETYTFATSSGGGMTALGVLITAASEHMIEGHEEYPIVELNVSSYKHKQFGKVWVPVFEIVGWSPIADWKTEEDEGGNEPAPKKAKPATKTGKRSDLNY